MWSTPSMVVSSASTAARRVSLTLDGLMPPLARPANLAHYGDPDAADLAGACAFGLARNHGFVDGNKRVAWLAARLFLADNGFGLEFDSVDAIRLIEGVASGVVSEPDLAGWFRQRLSRQR